MSAVMWEYLDICGTYTPEFNLNDYGNQGWELVAVYSGRFYFKRPKESRS